MLSLISLSLLGLLGGAQAAFDMSKNTNVAVYWGQNTAGDQLQLSDYCKEDSIDTVIMSFLTDFNGTGGLPILNLANTCSKASGTFKGSELADCSFLADQIKACQAKGKAVTLSLGGAASTVGFSSDEEATKTAQQMWDLFFDGGSNSTASPLDDGNSTTLPLPDSTALPLPGSTTLPLSDPLPIDDGDDTTTSAFSRRVIRRNAIRRASRSNSTVLPPSDPDSTLLSPDDGNSTVLPPAGGNSTITPPGDGNSTVLPPDNGNSTVLPPDNGNSTVTPPGDGNSTVTPPGNDNSTVTPPGSDNSTVPSSGDNSTTISTSGGNIRPFGDAILDGIDLDIEQGSSAHWATFVNAMRKLSQGSTKKFLITGAPQCPIPDKFLNDAISNSDFDAIYIQFYNNPPCALDSKDFNFEQWDEFARTKAKNKNMKVYIGAPGDKKSAGSGVVGADQLQTLAVDSQKKFKSFGGVMFFDASTAFDNDRFDKTIKQALLTGKVTPTNSTDSSNSTTTDPGNNSTSTLSPSDPVGTQSADPIDTTDPGALPTDTLSASDPFSTIASPTGTDSADPADPTDDPTDPTDDPTDPTDDPTDPTDDPADPTDTVVTADPTDPVDTTDSVVAPTKASSSKRPLKTSSAVPTDTDTTDLPSFTDPVDTSDPVVAPTKASSSRRPQKTPSAGLPASTKSAPTFPSAAPSDPAATADPADPTDDPLDPTDDPLDPTDDPADPADPTDDPLDPTDADPTSTVADPDDPEATDSSAVLPTGIPNLIDRRSVDENMPRVVSRHFRLLRRSAWQA